MFRKLLHRTLCFSPFSLSDYNEYGEGLFWFLKGRKGGHHLVHGDYIYRSNFRRQGLDRNIFYWECINNRKGRCRGRVKSVGDKLYIANSNGKESTELQNQDFSFQYKYIFTANHNHPVETNRIIDARRKGTLSLKTISDAAKEVDDKTRVKIEMVQNDFQITRM